MAYVAAKGGENAIQQAEKLFHTLKGDITKEMVDAVEQNMPYLIDRVMGEASLYSPRLAALALAQTGGDLYESVLLLRAYRSTQPRIAYANKVSAENQLIVRRISAAFKDIPGGQILGPTLDYSHRLLRVDVLEDGAEPVKLPVDPAEVPAKPNYMYVADWQRQNEMVDPLPEQEPKDPADIPDLTREPLLMPASREHRLQSLARAETGGVLSLGYANMRGYGGVHPTVNELRLAESEVSLTHPITGEPLVLGRIRTSQCEVVSTMPSDKGMKMELGFCATMGWNEVKNIAGSMLDLAMDKPSPHPAHEEEFVLYHTEVVESSGFCIHYKLPHYVTFNSTLDNYRAVMAASGWLRTPGEDEKKEKPLQSV